MMQRLSTACAALACFCLLALSAPGTAKPVTVAVISDLNGSYGSTDYSELASRVIQRITEINPDVVISTGDMVAGQQKPLLSRRRVESMWSAFHEVISTPLASASIPFAVTPGNHDGADSSDFRMERDLFAAQWKPRKPALHFLDDSNYPFYYAFTVKNVVFVSVDATLVGPLSGRQMAWLETLLKSPDLKNSRIVLFSHVPLWPFAKGREHDFIGDARLETILQKAGVDLYLSGHHHAFYPGHKDGIHYVSQACIGAGPRSLLGSGHRSPKGFTLIQIDEESIHVNMFNGTDLNQPVSWESLPLSIDSKAARLLRADRIDPAIDEAISLP